MTLSKLYALDAWKKIDDETKRQAKNMPSLKGLSCRTFEDI